MLKTFQDEYISNLRDHKFAHVVMLIDFDDQIDKRKAIFLKNRYQRSSSRECL